MRNELLEPDTEKFIRCDICGGEIYDGGNYWMIEDKAHCECCKDGFLDKCWRVYEAEPKNN